MDSVDWDARVRAVHGSKTITDMGYVVLVGMERIKWAETVSGTDDLAHAYVTYFPMPDDGEWELEIRRKV